MKKRIKILSIFVVMCIALQLFGSNITFAYSNGSVTTHSKLQYNLYEYLLSQENRKSIMQRAVELHGGDSANTCVYFVSESLRRAGLTNLPESTCNTADLTNKLQQLGWQRCTDFSKLLPGDVCFTTYGGNCPTHTYAFMSWVNPSNYDYAYICDNQGNEYGDSYHRRNVDFATSQKEATLYFMYNDDSQEGSTTNSRGGTNINTNSQGSSSDSGINLVCDATLNIWDENGHVIGQFHKGDKFAATGMLPPITSGQSGWWKLNYNGQTAWTLSGYTNYVELSK